MADNAIKPVVSDKLGELQALWTKLVNRIITTTCLQTCNNLCILNKTKFFLIRKNCHFPHTHWEIKCVKHFCRQLLLTTISADDITFFFDLALPPKGKNTFINYYHLILPTILSHKTIPNCFNCYISYCKISLTPEKLSCQVESKVIL